MSEIWVYRADIQTDSADVVGFDVEASDGGIGKVDEHSVEVGSSYLVVDTGFWIFGKKRLIPAGVVERVDYDGETVYVGMTKDEIKNAPDYEDDPIAGNGVDREPYDTYYRDYRGV
jgi:hypothetical protein